jgi:hypothetical protein
MISDAAAVAAGRKHLLVTCCEYMSNDSPSKLTLGAAAIARSLPRES